MTKRTALIPALIAGAMLACVVAVLAVPTKEAGAAFPGENGRIAFASNRDGDFDIYTMAPDGTGVRRLTSTGSFDGFPAYSPDGTKIAYTSKRDGNRDIYVMKASGTEERKLTDSPHRDDNPTWSPDGTEIAFTRTRDGDREIYAMDANGSRVRKLTDNSYQDNYPAWSPDGTRIAFSSNQDGAFNPDVYVMTANGADQHPVPYDADSGGSLPKGIYDWQPSWAPDGTRIAFRCAAWICVGGLDGSDTRQVSSNRLPEVASQPAWSPDGTKIAFVSGRDENLEIYATDADGSDQARLTASPSVDHQPDWRPVPASRR